jgi:hypothetical protein
MHSQNDCPFDIIKKEGIIMFGMDYINENGVPQDVIFIPFEVDLLKSFEDNFEKMQEKLKGEFIYFQALKWTQKINTEKNEDDVFRIKSDENVLSKSFRLNKFKSGTAYGFLGENKDIHFKIGFGRFIYHVHKGKDLVEREKKENIIEVIKLNIGEKVFEVEHYTDRTFSANSVLLPVAFEPVFIRE